MSTPESLHDLIDQYSASLSRLIGELNAYEHEKSKIQKLCDCLEPYFSPIALLLTPSKKFIAKAKRKLKQFVRNAFQINQEIARLSILRKSILSVLRIRDAIQQSILKNDKVSLSKLDELNRLDVVLKKQENQIAKALDLEEWRKILGIKEGGWWWYCIHPRNKLDWLWGALSSVFLIASLALAVDMLPRFFKGGPDAFGAFTIILPAVLSWLFGKESVEKAFQIKTSFESRLKGSNISQPDRQEFILLASGILLSIMLLFHLNKPIIANCYYTKAVDQTRSVVSTVEKEFSAAESNLLVAIAFEPDHAEANNLLGRIYELRRELEEARKKYKVASQSGSLLANARLARLEILSSKEAAVGDAALLILRPQKLLVSEVAKFISEPSNAEKKVDQHNIKQKELEQKRALVAWLTAFAWAKMKQGEVIQVKVEEEVKRIEKEPKNNLNGKVGALREQLKEAMFRYLEALYLVDKDDKLFEKDFSQLKDIPYSESYEIMDIYSKLQGAIILQKMLDDEKQLQDQQTAPLSSCIDAKLIDFTQKIAELNARLGEIDKIAPEINKSRNNEAIHKRLKKRWEYCLDNAGIRSDPEEAIWIDEAYKRLKNISSKK